MTSNPERAGPETRPAPTPSLKHSVYDAGPRGPAYWPTVSWLRNCRKLFSPMPCTFISSSTFLKGPCFSRVLDDPGGDLLPDARELFELRGRRRIEVDGCRGRLCLGPGGSGFLRGLGGGLSGERGDEGERRDQTKHADPPFRGPWRASRVREKVESRVVEFGGPGSPTKRQGPVRWPTDREEAGNLLTLRMIRRWAIRSTTTRRLEASGMTPGVDDLRQSLKTVHV